MSHLPCADFLSNPAVIRKLSMFPSGTGPKRHRQRRLRVNLTPEWPSVTSISRRKRWTTQHPREPTISTPGWQLTSSKRYGSQLSAMQKQRCFRNLGGSDGNPYAKGTTEQDKRHPTHATKRANYGTISSQTSKESHSRRVRYHKPPT
jgi:hypothetical protein